ncbi:hypothetical protein QPK87_05345 [Kamptonema cortianum]|nr:hypothetical protein [Geitlerinema splendidum]MDK3156002.1 hypothetical protein [Kamptonema cortianum]
MPELLPSERLALIQKFSFRLAIITTILAAIPFLVALVVQPAGKLYLGAQFSTDDHMVYAAWMRQAMDGQFFFDNRFASDAQPGLTVHLYFWVLGTIARLLSFLTPPVAIALISNLARLGFTFLFVILLGRFLSKTDFSVFVCRLSMILAIFGAGIGFLVWQPFGRLAVDSGVANALVDGRLTIDVWQPEAFVFPSMLVNGLFMVSLCLFIFILEAVVEAKDSWDSVPRGVVATLLLMNIHSYDVLLLAFILVGFLIANVASKQFDIKWILRAAAIMLGAVPAALWFVSVLSNDPVFQARAATLTYSPTFRQLVGGILPLAVLGLIAVFKPTSTEKTEEPKHTLMIGGSVLTLVIVFLWLGGKGYDPDTTYYLDFSKWGLAFAAVIAAVYLGARKSIGWNLVFAWAAVSIIAPYFPQLFQRKLAMGIVIPWAILAAVGLEALSQLYQNRVKSAEDFRNNRNMISGFICVLAGASSIFWFQREILLIRNDVSSTKTLPVYVTSDVREIVSYFNSKTERCVVIARPPTSLPSEGFESPVLPDINPVLSGFSRVYTVAGHWSESPDYNNRRAAATAVYDPNISDETRRDILRTFGVTHVVVTDPNVFDFLETADLSQYGQTVYSGRQYSIIEIDPSSL